MPQAAQSSSRRRALGLDWRCPIAKDGCYVVEVRDGWGRLLAIFVATDPDHFEWPEARIIAKLVKK